jgi:L-ascorbate metabolism protein UlaG (beta-lactamase superfamily)
MKLTFFGHASACVELSDTTLLTDPILRRRVSALRWTAALPPREQWAHADAALISHLHLDHCDLPSLARLGHSRTLVVPSGAEPLLRRRGFRNVIGLSPGSTTQVAGVTITAVEAKHDGRRFPVGREVPAVGYLVTAANGSVYFAGDTDLFAGMTDLAGRCDVALVPVWGWGRSIGDGHLDPVRAAEAVARIRPALAVPIHWGTLRPMWDVRPPSPQPAQDFAAHAQAEALPTEVRVLRPGGSTNWP